MGSTEQPAIKDTPTMTSSIFSTFADHNETLIAQRAVVALANGGGMGWGYETHTPREAAEDMGAIILHERADGRVLCETGDRLYMVCDVNGPWAVEVATQEDLAE